MTMADELPAVFVQYAAEVLGDTEKGLSGSQIVRITAAHAIECGAHIPHGVYPFEGVSKRVALFQNLMSFASDRRYRIIRELCDHPSVQERNRAAAEDLKIKLVTRYGHLRDETSPTELNEPLIEETRHWLDQFPEALALLNSAMQKHDHSIFTRNVLDDLRLSLEKLMQSVLGNQKSLENQIAPIGAFMKVRGASPESTNMFQKLIDYYCHYQNEYVKHDDAVIKEEVEFVLELTATLMKHVVRTSLRGAKGHT